MTTAMAVAVALICLVSAPWGVLARSRLPFPYSSFPKYNPANTCPDFKKVREKACTTGSCASELLTGLFSAPTDCNLITISNSGVLVFTGRYKTAFAGSIGQPDTASASINTAVAATGSESGVALNATNNPTSIVALQLDASVSCCKACKTDYNGQATDPANGFTCRFWQHFLVNGAGICFMYDGSLRPKCANTTLSLISLSTVGAKCVAQISNDPHLSGAHGTPYDFSGLPDQSFTLITDDSLNVNMKMTGYLDSRTESASIIKEGKAVRTWIRELGIMWVDAEGEMHTLHLLARPGKLTDRGEGYLKAAILDGEELPRLQAGESLSRAGGMSLSLTGVEKHGKMDVDVYNLNVDGVVNMEMRLRVAIHLLQTTDEAETHFSVGFNSIERTSNIHGVLGQTYRDDHIKRAFDFSKIAALLHHNIAADGEEGKGFLDGEPSDYRTSNVLAADCTFNAFKGVEKSALKMVTN